MKTYKTWEVIKLLGENPKLKFKTRVGDELGIIKVDDGYFETEFEKYHEGFDGNIKINNEWELIQEPVDFMTAFNSGKQIKPVCLDKEKSYHPYIYWLGFMVSCNAYKESPQPLDLINGKWYIEE